MYCCSNEVEHVFDSFLEDFRCLYVQVHELFQLFSLASLLLYRRCMWNHYCFLRIEELLLQPSKCEELFKGRKKINDRQLFFSSINFISHVFSCVFSELWDFFVLAIRAFEQRKLLLRCNDEFSTPAYTSQLNLGKTW